MSDSLRAAAAAYDAAMAALAGCRGLFAPPLTATKQAMLLRRLDAAGAGLVAAFRLVAAAAPEAPYIPLAAETKNARHQAHEARQAHEGARGRANPDASVADLPARSALGVLRELGALGVENQRDDPPAAKAVGRARFSVVPR